MKKTILLMFVFFGIVLTGPSAKGALFFSEYVEGISYNKALEIYNSGGGSVNLSGYSVEIFFNGNTSAGTVLNLNGQLAPGDVFVLADDMADPAILAETDQTSHLTFFNGNDAITLVDNGTVVDSIGQVGYDPGSQWGSGLASTQNNTLRRKIAIAVGDTDTSDAFDPSIEWDGFASDTFNGLGSHEGPVVPIPSALWLLGSGLIGLVGLRKKLKK